MKMKNVCASRIMYFIIFFNTIIINNDISYADRIVDNNKAKEHVKTVEIKYNKESFFRHIDKISLSYIAKRKKYHGRFENLKLPVSWNEPNLGLTFKMRIYHANPQFRKTKNVFIFIGGGPGEIIESMISLGDIILKQMGNNWDIIFIDTRGTGFSQVTNSGELISNLYLNMNEIVEDIYYLVRKLRNDGINKIILGGGSSGAFISLLYGISHGSTIDLLYIDQGATDSSFINESNKIANLTFRKLLAPQTINNLAKIYNIEPNLLFSEMNTIGQRDPLFKNPIWSDFIAGNTSGRDYLLKMLKKNPMVNIASEFTVKKEFANSGARQHFNIACAEILPIKIKKFPFNNCEKYQIVCKNYLNAHKIKHKPFDFTNEIKHINTKTLIVGGINDYIVPFSYSKNILKNANKDFTLLIGFKDTGHVVLPTHTKYIAKLLKKVLSTTIRSWYAGQQTKILNFYPQAIMFK